MKKIISIGFATLLCTIMIMSAFVTTNAKFSQTASPKKGDTVAVIHTNYGDIAMSFFKKYAPKGVENFITLAKEGKYDNTIFHRVIKNFMIQGGDYTNFDGTGGGSCWGKEFENECVDELTNIRGSVAYANAGADTNGSQFFINSVENTNLNGSYTVFGQVFSGMDVVDEISNCTVTTNSSGEQSSPVNKVKVESIEITKYSKNLVKSLAAAKDPYANGATEEATTIENGSDAATTTATETTTTDNSGIITTVVVVACIVVVIGGIIVAYVLYDKKQQKIKEANKAKKYPNKKKK